MRVLLELIGLSIVWGFALTCLFWSVLEAIKPLLDFIRNKLHRGKHDNN